MCSYLSNEKTFPFWVLTILNCRKKFFSQSLTVFEPSKYEWNNKKEVIIFLLNLTGRRLILFKTSSIILMNRDLIDYSFFFALTKYPWFMYLNPPTIAYKHKLVMQINIFRINEFKYDIIDRDIIDINYLWFRLQEFN